MNLLNVCSQVTTPLIFCMVVDCTPYHDWGAMVSVQWLDSCIYWSLPLPAVRTSMSITVELREGRLITGDTVAPVPKVPPSVRSSPHMSASPVIHSQSGTPGGTPKLIASSQKPVTLLQTDYILRNRRIISMRRRAAGMKRLSMTIWINSLSSWTMVTLLQLPSLNWCGRPMFRLCYKILLTNPWNTTF